MAAIQFTPHPRLAPEDALIAPFDLQTARTARNFHQSFPTYCPTPLQALPGLAGKLGLKNIFVKDESKRFGLNAFKALGGSYAIAACLAQRLGLDFSELTAPVLLSEDIRARLGNVTFIAATDGNHGRGIAWTAGQLKQRVIVYVPKGTTQRRIEHIRRLGAEVELKDCYYDDTARMALQAARENGWILAQDTSFEGYADFPRWCMQGYTTMSLEAMEQLQAVGEAPSHIFIQAGCGSLAASVAGFFRDAYRKNPPVIAVVESRNCDCLRQTAACNDGKLHSVTGDISTIMAGLSVGDPCDVAWKVLDGCVDAFLSCSDAVTAQGMRILAAPLGEDPRITSGESGAAGFAAAVQLMMDPQYADIRRQLKLDENSRLLCFSTEGDTDPEMYERIVWKGTYPLDGEE